jgi:hypothetical protein
LYRFFIGYWILKTGLDFYPGPFLFLTTHRKVRKGYTFHKPYPDISLFKRGVIQIVKIEGVDRKKRIIVIMFANSPNSKFIQTQQEKDIF